MNLVNRKKLLSGSHHVHHAASSPTKSNQTPLFGPSLVREKLRPAAFGFVFRKKEEKI